MQQNDQINADYHQKEHSGFVGEPEKAKILLNEGEKENLTTERDVHLLNQKLRIQNEKLRSQLKELSYKLTETLEKVKNKKPERSATEFRDETLRKELDNANKQTHFYQKEIEKLKYKIDTTHTHERVTKLENILREKERVIEEMTVEKRNLDKIKRDQEKQLEILKNDRDYITRLDMYSEEVRGLKEKIREMYRHEKHEEKSFKKQQEYLVILEGKYREVCEKAGVSSSLNFTTSQEMNDRSLRFKSAKPRENSGSVGKNDLKKIGVQSTKNLKRSLIEEDKGFDDEKIELTEAKFKELRNIIQILKKSKETSDRRYKSEIDQLNSKMRDMEYDMNKLKSDYREKEKELNILLYKYNELKRLTKHSQLTPIDQAPNQKLPDKSIDKVKSSSQLGSNKLSPKSRVVPGRKEKKGRVNIKGLEFDDFSIAEKDTKISKFTVWFDNDQIYGVRAVYNIHNGSDVAGKEHLFVEQKDKIECQAIEIDADDRIAVVSGKYKNFIGYLKIATAKGVTHEFGNENSKNSTTPFMFDIEINEQPSVLFGGLEKIDANNYALAYLGFQIVKVESNDEIKDETTNHKP